MKKVFATAILVVLTGLSSPSTYAQQKTVKACQEEWRANKAANQAAGKTEKAYVAECRAASAKSEPAKKPEPEKKKPVEAAKPAKPAEAAAPAKPAEAAPAKPAEKPKAATAAAGANQFTTEAQAKAHCPSDTVVWVNLNSKIYHYAGKKDYGNTKRGAYACEKDTAAMGARAAKDEKHP